MVIVLGVAVVGLVAIGLLNHHSATGTSVVTPSTSTSPAPSTSSSIPTSQDKGYAPTSGNLSSNSSGQLPAPTGQLLNLHTISLSADPAMESACQTTTNASCEIQLTQGSITKTVGPKSTDSSGIALIDWKAQALGLTTGQWTVRAVATQNGQTGTSASDYLMVNP